MKTYKVYEIINSMGTVEYVGETFRSLESRMYDHKRKPVGNNGKFYGRNDVMIYQVAEFNNRADAKALEGQLKIEYGLEWTERSPAGGKIGGMSTSTLERVCPYCGTTMIGRAYFRYHGERCKNKINHG